MPGLHQSHRSQIEDSRHAAIHMAAPWPIRSSPSCSAEQGLRAVTIDAAYALGDEDRRGHLAPGAYADITILSGDVTSARPRRDSRDGRRGHHRRRSDRALRGPSRLSLTHRPLPYGARLIATFASAATNGESTIPRARLSTLDDGFRATRRPMPPNPVHSVAARVQLRR
ncbi:MAG: amidohydrolase family protein [Candidatus Limnocylindria bacterium]